MEISSVTPAFFDEIIARPFYVYGSASFALINTGNAEKVHYLLFKDTKYRLGLVAGERGGELFSPFSAPFGGFVYVNREIKTQMIEESVAALLDWAVKEKFTSLYLVLPPAIYEESFIAKQANVLYRSGFSISRMDLNFSFRLNPGDRDYPSLLYRNARKNLNIALEQHLRFFPAVKRDEQYEAFQIIRKNREARQFSLSMTWEQILATIEVIPAEFFLVSTGQHEHIGAAMVYKFSEKIRQVIYWGDIPGYSHLKTMNFMAYKLFEHYRNEGIELLDIGPSTDENSVPYYGVCDFKESIGGEISQKLTFRYDLIS